MRQKATIRSGIALALLLTLALATAPKLFFHQFLADHRDAPACAHREPADHCVHTLGYQCHFDDLVVTMPFLMEGYDPSFPPAAVFPAFAVFLPFFHPFRCQTFRLYRGPPKA